MLQHTENFTRVVPYQIEGRGWGLVATRDIQANDAVVSVQADNMITSFDRFKLSDYLDGAHEYLKMLVRLVYEKFINRDGSFINIYVRSLPNDFNFMYDAPPDVKDTIKKKFQ